MSRWGISRLFKPRRKQKDQKPKRQIELENLEDKDLATDHVELDEEEVKAQFVASSATEVGTEEDISTETMRGDTWERKKKHLETVRFLFLSDSLLRFRVTHDFLSPV